MNERNALSLQAHTAVIDGDFPQAYALYERLLQTNPSDVQVLLDYGKAIYAQFEDMDRAIRLFESVLERDPGNVEALLWLGDIAALGYGPGQEGAVAFYQRAIERDPGCVDAYIGLGLQFRAPGVTLSAEEAIQAFHQAIALDPQRADAYQDLAIILLHKGDRRGARNAFSSAIEQWERIGNAKQARLLRQCIDQIDRNEEVKIPGSWNNSPRYRWFSEA